MSAGYLVYSDFSLPLGFSIYDEADARKHSGSGPESLSLTDVWKFGNRLD